MSRNGGPSAKATRPSRSPTRTRSSTRATATNSTAGTVTPFNTATGHWSPASPSARHRGIAISPGRDQGLRPQLHRRHGHADRHRHRHRRRPDHRRHKPGRRGLQPGRHQGLRHRRRATPVTPITVASDRPVTPIAVGHEPEARGLHPDGTKAYVTNAGTGTVTPITVATDTPGAAITVGRARPASRSRPDGTKAYVANNGAGTVTPITVATNIPGAPITVGSGPHRRRHQPGRRQGVRHERHRQHGDPHHRVERTPPGPPSPWAQAPRAVAFARTAPPRTSPTTRRHDQPDPRRDECRRPGDHRGRAAPPRWRSPDGPPLPCSGPVPRRRAPPSTPRRRPQVRDDHQLPLGVRRRHHRRHGHPDHDPHVRHGGSDGYGHRDGH